MTLTLAIRQELLVAEVNQHNFDELMQQLEDVVMKLEKENLPLETAIEVYERGVALAKQGQARLAAAEQRLQELTEEGETSPLHLPSSPSEP